jgi:chromosome segregation ATPase
LREFLEEMEKRLATKADLDAMRQGIVEHLRAEIRTGDEETRRTLGTEIRALDAKIDVTARELRQGQADIIERLDEGFAARKEDEDLALREIRAVKRRVTSLERRVKLLESTKQ